MLAHSSIVRGLLRRHRSPPLLQTQDIAAKQGGPAAVRAAGPHVVWAIFLETRKSFRHRPWLYSAEAPIYCCASFDFFIRKPTVLARRRGQQAHHCVFDTISCFISILFPERHCESAASTSSPHAKVGCGTFPWLAGEYSGPTLVRMAHVANVKRICFVLRVAALPTTFPAATPRHTLFFLVFRTLYSIVVKSG